MPFLELGTVIDPNVSVPKAKGTNPAEVALPEPAEEPPAPLEVSQGFLVFPPKISQDESSKEICQIPGIGVRQRETQR